MSSQPHRLDELQGLAKTAFFQSNDEIWERVQGDPPKIHRVKEIQDRAHSLRLRMKTHIYKHSQQWESQEAIRILEDYGRSVLEYPRPSWISETLGTVSYLEEARRRVQSRNQMRMQRINTAKDRMEKGVIQAQVSGRRAPDLESRVHRIVSHTQELRAQAKKDFKHNRDRWLREARTRGTSNPEQDVLTMQRDGLAQIDQDEHKRIRQAFQTHGQVLPGQQNKDRTHDHGQVMQ